MARFGHRFGSIASALALVGGMLLAPAPAIAAATCEVTNAGTDIKYPTLQEAVDAAASGDTLEVRGTCVGKTVIRTTRLRLKGDPDDRAADPHARRGPALTGLDRPQREGRDPGPRHHEREGEDRRWDLRFPGELPRDPPPGDPER